MVSIRAHRAQQRTVPGERRGHDRLLEETLEDRERSPRVVAGPHDQLGVPPNLAGGEYAPGWVPGATQDIVGVPGDAVHGGVIREEPLRVALAVVHDAERCGVIDHLAPRRVE